MLLGHAGDGTSDRGEQARDEGGGRARADGRRRGEGFVGVRGMWRRPLSATASGLLSALVFLWAGAGAVAAMVAAVFFLADAPVVSLLLEGGGATRGAACSVEATV